LFVGPAWPGPLGFACRPPHHDGPSHRPKSPSDYRFGRIQGKPVRGSLHYVTGPFKRLVEAVVNSKLRRMERELELRGIRIRNEN
jgi:hypothetical protein